MKSDLIEEMRRCRLVAIARHVPENRICGCAEAVLNAGIDFLEITFDPSDPDTVSDVSGKVETVRNHFPMLHVGCGTVLNSAFAAAAGNSGAAFAVAPNTKADVIAEAHRLGMIAIPGAYTPCEIANAYDMGADVVKIFPVLPGCHGYVSNVMSPLSHIPFMVTGGINAQTIHDMLATGAVAVAAGVTILRTDLVAAGDWRGITALAKQMLENI